MGISIKLDPRAVTKISAAIPRASLRTMMALQTEVVAAQVMPYDQGTMQGSQTSAEQDGDGAQLVTDAVQANRLYHHPEYDFQTVNNPNARGEWLEDWINGGKADSVPETFAAALREEAGL